MIVGVLVIIMVSKRASGVQVENAAECSMQQNGQKVVLSESVKKDLEGGGLG